MVDEVENGDEGVVVQVEREWEVEGNGYGSGVYYVESVLLRCEPREV